MAELLERHWQNVAEDRYSDRFRFEALPPKRRRLLDVVVCNEHHTSLIEATLTYQVR